MTTLSIQTPACGRRSSPDDMATRATLAERMFDPLLSLMNDRNFDWGIIADVEEEMGIVSDMPTTPVEAVPTWDSMLHNGWDVIEVMPGYYSTRNLDDDEFERLMTWLCGTGWEISTQSRILNIVSCHHCNTNVAATQWKWSDLDEAVEAAAAATATATATASAPEDRYAVPKNACGKCGTHHWISKTPCPTGTVSGLSKPGTDVGKRDGAPVPRFCNLGRTCSKPGCRYVHGDTIPRINAPCRFNSTCTGEKRACCLHMHTGEKYVKGMVLIRR